MDAERGECHLGEHRTMKNAIDFSTHPTKYSRALISSVVGTPFAESPRQLPAAALSKAIGGIALFIESHSVRRTYRI